MKLTLSSFIHPALPTRQTIFHCTLMLVLVIAGCSTKIRNLPEQAQIELPNTWQATQNESPNKDDPSTSDLNTSVENGWLHKFADQQLVEYAQQALDNNPNLLASAAQLKSAIQQVTISRAQLLPRAQFSFQDNETEVQGPAGGVSTVNGVAVDASGAGDATGTITTTVSTIRATLDISWEADIWGKLSQRKKSASLSAKAQAELFKAAELSLIANVSRAWFNTITNRLLVDLATQRLESFQRTANLIDENYRRGLRSALDVYLSRTDVQVQISNLAEAEFNLSQSVRAFKTLLGQYPDSRLSTRLELPEIDDHVPLGLPAELLTRRPDISASLFDYQAQIASAKAAHRDRFPSVTFSGAIGDSRDDFGALFENDNMIQVFIQGLTQPVFLAGELKARARNAIFQAEAAYASLIDTTLSALQEVEDVLAREQSLKAQHIATQEAVKFAQGGLDLALDRYQSGIENYTTVLEAQRRLYGSRENEINIRNALLQNRINLHLALGGDFSQQAERDPSATLSGIK